MVPVKCSRCVEQVNVVAGSDGWPTAYAYQVNGRTITIPLSLRCRCLAQKLIPYQGGYHPTDDHYGAGCLAAADRGRGDPQCRR